MPKRSTICLVAFLCLLFGVSPVWAEEISPEYRFYFPLIAKAPPGDMVYIPAGPFMMGCDPEHNGDVPCQTLEFPLQVMTLDAYYIDRYEVTNAQYAACVAAGVCFDSLVAKSTATRPDYYANLSFANNPAFIEDSGAGIYCAWFGKRVPREPEWEKAARGSNDTRAYPWGDATPTCDLANFAGCIGDTAPVGSYPAGASPYGVMDMAGNADEWNFGRYFVIQPDNLPNWPGDVYQPVRGGNWNSDAIGMRVAARVPRFGPGEYSGLRCVISAP